MTVIELSPLTTSHRADSVTWRLLPHILAAAFLVRAAFSLATGVISHPDEIFQYLEPAHRLVFGQGIVPWEYQYGIRSWIIPGFVAIILKILATIGLDRPEVYQPAVRLVFCAISLSLPLSVYRIAQAMLDEAAARLALIAAAFWPLLIYFSASPMPDALAAYTLFAALALLSGPPTYLSSLSFGALAGLTFALRFQIAPMLGPAILIAVWRWRSRGWLALVGFGAVISLAGALDAYTWDRWFSSVVTNVELNLFAHVSDAFGTEPAYFYLVILAISSAGLAYFGAFGLALS
jgi:phosphatidylinositol glycan class B